MEMYANIGDNSEQNGGKKSCEITSVPLVFLHERHVFGFQKPSNAFLKHEEMYIAIGEVIAPSHITGLQK
jgi:hypothetical protein